MRRLCCAGLASRALPAVAAGAPANTSYEDLGPGICLLGCLDPEQLQQAQFVPNGGPECSDLCSANSSCGGYSVSEIGHCILWLGPAEQISGRGRAWGRSHCMAKIPARGGGARRPTCGKSEDDSGSAAGADDAVERAATYVNKGLGRCLINGIDPERLGRGSFYPADSVNCTEKCIRDCENRCTAEPTCGGYSANEFGNCLLWIGDRLQGGGATWGNATCMVKQAAPTAPLAAAPSLGARASVGIGVAVGAVAVGTSVAMALRCRATARARLKLSVLAVDKRKDPAWAAISVDQLLDLRNNAQTMLGDAYAAATMHDVNRVLIQPLCAESGMCYAHTVNREQLLHATVFVSHAWQENFQAFVESVLLPFRNWALKPNLWICATALVQTTDRKVISLQVGTGTDPSRAPFTKALARCDKLLVVRNETVDLYDRIWCCWEFYMAYQLGMIHRPGAIIVVGPASFDGAVDIARAQSSDEEDKRKILRCISKSGRSFEDINAKLAEIRRFDSQPV